MSKVIYKYPIMGLGPQQWLLPEDAKIIHFGEDGERRLSVWAEVNLSKNAVPCGLRIIGTGVDQVPEGCTHRGSAVDKGGYVWHLYQK